MVLGLIDFLLGGKKKIKTSKSGQVSGPLTNVGGNNSGVVNNANQNSLPDGVVNPTSNMQSNADDNNLQFEDSSKPEKVKEQDSSQQFQPQQNITNTNSGNPMRKSVSEVINKIHDELKNTNEKIGEIVADIRSVENNIHDLTHRVDDLDESKKIIDEKLSEIDSNMTKFLSLYELINNQYNPFVEQGFIPQTQVESNKPIVLENNINGSQKEFSQEELSEKLNNINSSNRLNSESKIDLNSSLLELDTLNIQEAAGNAVPLTNIKNNTNSLVIILSWLEYLIKKVGLEETRNSLRYYTETLRWITPEVFFDLDKYLRGMNDKEDFSGKERLNVRDHIVSLYFISKLNEKTLDEKLTRAVLQIIKE